MPTNGIASAQDFKKAAEHSNPPERVILPKSGLPVLLRKPNPLGALLLAEELRTIGPFDQASAENRVRFVSLRACAVRELVVSPKLSLTPGPGEIDPNWLPQEDAQFLLDWSLGIPASPDAREFPGKSARDGASGQNRPSVGNAPERDGGYDERDGAPV
jgi:hypothetical protein